VEHRAHLPVIHMRLMSFPNPHFKPKPFNGDCPQYRRAIASNERTGQRTVDDRKTRVSLGAGGRRLMPDLAARGDFGGRRNEVTPPHTDATHGKNAWLGEAIPSSGKATDTPSARGSQAFSWIRMCNTRWCPPINSFIAMNDVTSHRLETLGQGDKARRTPSDAHRLW
jgi:hypothetical protein